MDVRKMAKRAAANPEPELKPEQVEGEEQLPSKVARPCVCTCNCPGADARAKRKVGEGGAKAPAPAAAALQRLLRLLQKKRRGHQKLEPRT